MLNWIELSSLDQLSELDKISYQEFVIVFKHSSTCSISVISKLRLEDAFDIQIKAYLLDLKKYREISNAISENYSVHHESPQILLIKNGECYYDASHFDITISELKEALEEAEKMLC